MGWLDGEGVSAFDIAAAVTVGDIFFGDDDRRGRRDEEPRRADRQESESVEQREAAHRQAHELSDDTTKTAPEIGPKIGDVMEDGTILAGYYEGKPLYAAPRDAPGTYAFNQAARYAANLDVHGHRDFHVPSKDELNVLWENRNKGKLAGTFNETGSAPAGWYWSSTLDYFGIAWAQRFSDGTQDNDDRNFYSSLRCVR